MTTQPSAPQGEDQSTTTDEFDAAFAEFAGADTATPDKATDSTEAVPGDKGAPSTAEPKGEAEPAPSPAPAPSPTPKAHTLDDLLALVPEDKRSQAAPTVEGLKKDLQRWRSEQGRLPAFQRLYETERQRAQRLEAELEALRKAPPPAPVAPAPAAEDDAQDFPELRNAVRMELTQVLKSALPTTGQPSEPAKSATTVAPVDLAPQLMALADAHPDWQDVSASQEFDEWVKAQPPAVQKMRTSSTDANDAIWVLNQFKEARAVRERAAADEAAAKRKRLEQQVGPKGAPLRTEAPADDFDAAFAHFARGR